MNLYLKSFLAVGIPLGILTGGLGLVLIGFPDGLILGLFGGGVSGLVALSFSVIHSLLIRRIPSESPEGKMGVHHVRSFVKDESPFLRCSVSYFLGYNMEILSEEYKRLVNVLAQDEKDVVREYIPSLIATHFERLPEECRKLLFVLAQDREGLIRADVVPPLGETFEKLPEKYRRLLLTLAVDEDEFVREKMASTLGYNFEKLPEEYRKILFTLARDKDRDVRGAVAGSVLVECIICQGGSAIGIRFLEWITQSIVGNGLQLL